MFTNHYLDCKSAYANSCWYISASDIGVVGGSGATATVWCLDVVVNGGTTTRNDDFIPVESKPS